MNAETIKSFLASPGFLVDEDGQRKVETTLAGVISQTAKLEGAAQTVVAFIAKIVQGLDDLYGSSQRTGTGLQQIDDAVVLVGSNAAAAHDALEHLSRFMRNSPGAEGFFSRLGVQIRDVSGQMYDMATIFTRIGQLLSQTPTDRANQYAQRLGIDENTLLLMRRGPEQYSAEYTATAKTTGLSAEQAAAGSNSVTTSLDAFGMVASMERDSNGANLALGKTGAIDNFCTWVIDNVPKIETGIAAILKAVLWLADEVEHVVYRVVQAAGAMIDGWSALDKSTQQVIVALGSMVVAWHLLNSAFAVLPIEHIIALAGLVKDYTTWKEGEHNLIDGPTWASGIQYAQKAMGGLSSGFSTLYDKVTDLGSEVWEVIKTFVAFINIDTSRFSGKGFFDPMIESVRSTIKYVGALVDALKTWGSGDFSVALGSLNEAVTVMAGSPVAQGAVAVAGGLYTKTTGALNQHMSEWGDGTPEANQRRQEANNPLFHTLNRTQSGSRQDAGTGRAESHTVRRNTATLPGFAVSATERLRNAIAPQTEGHISEPLPYRLHDPSQASVAVNVPQPSKQGLALQGLFQRMHSMVNDLGLRGHDVFDPLKSVQVAANYLVQRLRASGDSLDNMLASYHWEIGNVQKHGMALMPQETRRYIPKVRSTLPGATINQETHITVNGATDARSTADAIAGKQDGVNSRTVQQITMGHR